MSKLKIYAIKDKAAEAYLQPFFTQTDGMAVRMVQGGMEKGDTNLSKYPEDFSLWYIGEYDEHTGVINALDDIKLVMKISDLVIKD